MMTNFNKVKEFHLKFGLTTNKICVKPTAELALFRSRLVVEETAELVKALQSENIPEIAKELADILYVVYGTAVSLGIEINEVFDEVHKSNMTKSPAKDAGGKVVKGDGYVPPDIEKALVEGLQRWL